MQQKQQESGLPPPQLANMRSRIFALILDAILMFFLASLVITYFTIPSLPDEEQQGLRSFWQEYTLAMQAQEQNSADAKSVELTLSEEAQRAMLHIMASIIIISWMYFSLSEWLMKGCTLGKKIFTLRTIHQIEKRAPKSLECLIRNGIKSISLLAIFFLPDLLFGNFYSGIVGILAVDYIYSFFSSQKQTLHDLATRCIVVEPGAEKILDEIA